MLKLVRGAKLVMYLIAGTINFNLTIMQQHIYTTKRSKIISQTFLAWLVILLQVALNVYAITLPVTRYRNIAILIVNIFMLCMNIPSLYIFINYYRYSKNKRFVITYNYLRLKDIVTGKAVEIKDEDIVKIELVSSIGFKHPWSDHEYFCFTDLQKNKIIITSYMMNIADFWLDTLSHKINTNKLTRYKKFFLVLPKG